MDNPPDLVVSPYDGVKPAPASEVGEITSEALQSLILLFRIGVFSPLGAPDILEHSKYGFPCHSVSLQGVAQPCPVGREPHEDVLGRNIGVPHLVGLALGVIQSLLGLTSEAHLGRTVHGREVGEPFV